jgi:lipopolysaccharide/colanic/teichoic acid biosynthesis glycosyltransferase
MGQNGRKFTVYKFRSMHRDAEKRLEEVKQNNLIKDGPIFKWKQDSRITKVGRFLRRTSLDELPQLWNVLLGNMSLVGPRPPLESEVMEYESWQLRRLAVKPGMTGLWQVSGRSNLGFVQMVGLDIDYIEAWSVWRDITLLAKTPLAVITARGAY